MYEFHGRVRYSEVDSERRMTLQALLDYLQDCCTFQSEDMGIGVDYLNKAHSAWVLSSWQIRINRLPVFGEQIKTGTWPYGVKGIYGYRNFLIEDEKEFPMVEVNSLWVFMDTVRMRPARVDEYIEKAYESEYAPELPGDWGDRKISIPGEEEILSREKMDPVTVSRYQIDTNHHMNNSRYIQAAQIYVPEESEVGMLRVEYKKAATLGDVMYPVVTKLHNGDIIIELTDENGRDFSIIQFEFKKRHVTEEL